MKVLTDLGAEDFLRKHGFDVLETQLVKKESELVKMKLDFPIAMKIASKTIVHKTLVHGIRLGIKNKEQALKAFSDLMKIKGAEGVLVQKQAFGEEFLVGLKKTPEFGYVVAFGKGGSKVEKMKKVDFRVCDVKGVEDLTKNKSLQQILFKLCKLSNYKIESLDINPLIIEKGKPIIIDTQIVFE